MRSVTAEEMRRMDQMATKQYEIPETLLVENAARSILQCIDLSTRHTFAIFCGPGNNGADGLALARHLLGRGKKVMVYLIDKSDHPSEAWRINRTCIGHMTDAIRAIETLGDLDDMLQELKQYNTVIESRPSSSITLINRAFIRFLWTCLRDWMRLPVGHLGLLSKPTRSLPWNV